MSFPTPVDQVARAKSHLGHLVRNGAAESDILAARRDLGAALLKKRAREIVARSPRPTDAQIEDVVRVLRRPASLIASTGGSTTPPSEDSRRPSKR